MHLGIGVAQLDRNVAPQLVLEAHRLQHVSNSNH